MPAQHLELQFSRMEDFGPMSIEGDGETSYPEKRLWVAVVLATFDEYEEWVLRICKIWQTQGRPISEAYFDELRRIRRECHNHWFARICELADVPLTRVFDRFDEIEKDCGLSGVPHTTDNCRVISRWFIRKSRKKNKS